MWIEKNNLWNQLMWGPESQSRKHNDPLSGMENSQVTQWGDFPSSFYIPLLFLETFTRDKKLKVDEMS